MLSLALSVSKSARKASVSLAMETRGYRTVRQGHFFFVVARIGHHRLGRRSSLHAVAKPGTHKVDRDLLRRVVLIAVFACPFLVIRCYGRAEETNCLLSSSRYQRARRRSSVPKCPSPAIVIFGPITAFKNVP